MEVGPDASVAGGLEIVTRLEKLNHANGVKAPRDATISQDFNLYPRLDVTWHGTNRPGRA
jgi:hypothetical protein